ncbi:hypothetical protein F7725_027575 [Dissostichus mawsoni]|uniref:Chromatin assembly factor 1 subunit A n=1 Tax=Dissostichus mawsoni TaxID=36200 RepID=A0A7J5XEH6_DISMA|nr:hypothetical protein F7725_027575 [Dissostichus mawsoni]
MICCRLHSRFFRLPVPLFFYGEFINEWNTGLVVGMLAAETPSVDGHLAASTPRRRGMDCKSSKNANKTLIQARLPFKRMNPEPKENQPPKRPCAHTCPKPGDSDRENENESYALSAHCGPPLVNGRGPLDGFLSRRRPAPADENMVIDLTADNALSPIKRLVSPATTSPRLPAKDKHLGKDKTTLSEKSSSPKTHTLDCTVVETDDEEDEEDEEMEEEEANLTASVSQIDTTQDSESEPEEQEESGNRSMLSASSASGTSESSPEKSKTDDPTSTSTPSTKVQEQEERHLLRQEKDRQREEAKAAKEKKKEEARRLKEEREKEKRERKEKDEQEKREKKEKEEKEKADKLKAKEDLRKSKQEKKEEEKQMKEEEKRLKEEKDRVKAGKAEITRFLQKSKIQQAPKTLAATCGKFAPFEIKEHMALAPLCRVQCEESVLEELDRCLLKPADNLNGLKDWIRDGPRSSGPTKPRKPLSDCLPVEETKPDGVPDRDRYGPMKLLQFHANHRPAYWGTWSKKSENISPRCPLRQDKGLLDYEVDSDDEWEEEEPGESLSHSEGEEEGGEGGEVGDDDSDDDGFFVPHGYLSEDECALEEEEGGDLEKQKIRQKVKAKEWDELMSTKKKMMKVLDPVVRGCLWEGEDLDCSSSSLMLFVWEPLPKVDTSPGQEELSLRKSQREEQLLSRLLPLLHGNTNSSKVIISEFQEFCRQPTTSSSSPPELSSPQSQAENIPTRIQVKRLMKSNAAYEKRSTYRRCCWYVQAEVLTRFGQDALPVPCQWTYLTTGAREESRCHRLSGKLPHNPTELLVHIVISNKRKSTGSMSITKFMKKCADPEQAIEADGFQADTEEDDEEDCVIVSTKTAPTRKSSNEGDCVIEVTPSDTAALPVSSAAPTLSTA